MIIYKILNKLNQKIYIGQTIQSLNKRWINHCVGNGHCFKLKNAISKYGKENFSIERIDEAKTLEELNEKEVYWINFYKSNTNVGYNLKSGGANSRVSEETKLKISKTTKGRKGKPHSELTKEKLRQINFGKKLSEKTKNKMRNRTHSAETREKMKLSHAKRLGKNV